MTKRKRRIIIISVLAIAILGVGIYYYLMSRDIAPPDVSDLDLEYLDIPNDENAFTYINEAGIIWEPIRRGMRVLDIVTPIDKYDPKEMEKLITSCRDVFEKLARGLECRQLQFPKITSRDTLLTYLSSFRYLARMQLNRSLHLFKQGREKEAFDILIDTVRFGAMMERGKGCFNNFLVGLKVKYMALERLRELLAETTLKTETLRPYIEKLKPYFEDGESLAHAIKLEFHIWSHVIDEFRDGKRPYWHVLSYPPFRFLRMPYSFKPNETRKILADLIRTHAANLDKPCDKFVQSEFPPSYGTIFGLRVYNGSNWVGKELCRRTEFDSGRFIIIMTQGNVTIGATQLSIALKCYKLDNGELPDSIDELVPKYIDKIPIDHFDKKPLRYSREKKIIYSVGADMKDSGGPSIEEMEKRDRKRRRNLSLFLWKEGKPAFKIDF